MTFFNKKEDVLELVLTPYGRKLLSHGKLKPEFYAFYDDDILYDTGKANFSESNSESKTRILSETPSMRVQSVNYAIETNNETNYEDILDNFMPNAIGTNSLIEKKTSGWNIIALDKEMDTFSLSSSLNSSIQNIPQINCTCAFTMSVGNPSVSGFDFSELANSYDIEFDEVGNFIKIEKETLVFYLMEKNGFVNSDSFEVEVFMYEEDNNNLKKLSFEKEQNRVVNDIFEPGQKTNIEHTPDFVEHFIDLLVDSEVPDEEICKGITKLKESNIYLDLDLKCPDRDLRTMNIYNSTIGDVEECD